MPKLQFFKKLRSYPYLKKIQIAKQVELYIKGLAKPNIYLQFYHIVYGFKIVPLKHDIISLVKLLYSTK